MADQVPDLPDGGHFEASTGYHAFATELAAYGLATACAGSRADHGATADGMLDSLEEVDRLRVRRKPCFTENPESQGAALVNGVPFAPGYGGPRSASPTGIVSILYLAERWGLTNRTAELGKLPDVRARSR